MMKMKWLHILGSDIMHHNRTLLAFFATEIAPRMQEKPQFWVVSREDLSSEFPALLIRRFASKKALAKALIAKNRADLTACFFFHGQFNGWIWLAILFGQISPKRCVWHIWGADLYESSHRLAFKVFYQLRRLAQKRLKKVYGTQGDLATFAKINGEAKRSLLYFPTKMPEGYPFNRTEAGEKYRGEGDKLTILLGNSGDRSNHHLAGLAMLKKWGANLNLRIPMGYPAHNEAYITEVEQCAITLFGAENVEVWRERQPFAKYWQDLTACHLGYFPFERQQGIGTLCLLIMLNIPFVLKRANSFSLDLENAGVPFLYDDEISQRKIAETAEKLQRLEKSHLAFFPDGYRHQWLKLLEE